MLLLTVYWKADLALFRRPDLEKDKNKEQIWPGAVRRKIIIVRAVIQSWNFADFDLHISIRMGFRQWTIIMPLIPISCPSVSCCRRCLRCAKRCSFCSAVSRWRLLLRCSRWIWSRRSRSRGVSVENLPARALRATILWSRYARNHLPTHHAMYCSHFYFIIGLLSKFKFKSEEPL